jgi:hypothetical protein
MKYPRPESPYYTPENEEAAEFGIVELQNILKQLKKQAQPRIEPKDFMDIYDKQSIFADLKKVEELKAHFAEISKSKPQENEVSEYNKILGEIMELVIVEHGGLSNWFGPDARLVQTSEADGLLNDVNLVLVFGEDDKNPVALTVDVTSAKDISVIDAKITASCQRALARRADQRTVKYYQDPTDADTKGAVEAIPVVIGFSQDTAKNVIELIHELLQQKAGKSDKPSDNRAEAIHETLARHSVQMNMLEEISCQLKYYLKNIDPARAEYVGKINFLLAKIEEITDEKSSADIQSDDNDIVFKRILNNIANKTRD